MKSLTIEGIIDMDEDNKIEYEALDVLQHLNKAEVCAMVAQITEDPEFSTSEVEVLTLEEIETREGSFVFSVEEMQ